MKQYYIFFLMLMFLLINFPSHAANLVFNGGFELPGFSVPNYYRYLLNGDSTTIQGWVVSDDGIGEASYLMNNSNGHYTCYEGTYSLSLNQGSSIRTTFATLANVSYQLSFYTAVSIHPNATPLRVKVGDYVATFNTTGIQTFYFTATSTNANTLLEFINDGPVGDFKIHTLDSISIIVMPEPGTIALCLFAFLFLLRKKR